MNIPWITVSYVNIQEKSSPRDIHLTWLFYIIEPPDRNIGAWDDTSTSWNKYRVTINNKYKWIHSKVTITSTKDATRKDSIELTILEDVQWYND